MNKVAIRERLLRNVRAFSTLHGESIGLRLEFPTIAAKAEEKAEAIFTEIETDVDILLGKRKEMPNF